MSEYWTPAAGTRSRDSVGYNQCQQEPIGASQLQQRVTLSIEERGKAAAAIKTDRLCTDINSRDTVQPVA